MNARLPRVTLAAIALSSLVVTACAAGGAAPSGEAAATPPSSTAPGEGPSPSPTGPVAAGALDPAIPTACHGLGPADCERARAMVATVLVATDPVPVYVQVGPFGCAAVERCPTTLAARPEGDVTIEGAGATGINVHLTVAPDGSFQAVRGEPMGIAVEPSSAPAVVSGPEPYTLGHCGLLSGIDVAGSWWDPVGPVDVDHPDAINAAQGVMTFSDPDHAMFTSANGLSVALQRRIGAKLLPLCM